MLVITIYHCALLGALTSNLKEDVSFFSKANALSTLRFERTWATVGYLIKTLLSDQGQKTGNKQMSLCSETLKRKDSRSIYISKLECSSLWTF